MLLRALGITGVVVIAVVVLHGSAATADDARSGEQIWQRDCAVCHGTDGSGTFRAPDITSKGTADVDFMVRTGRMPINEPHDAVRRRPPRYSETEIRALVAYTDHLVTGPRVPSVDVHGADVAAGAEVYQQQCAACHQAAGAGGALAYGTVAPRLTDATAPELVEAMRVGPGSMPVFPSSLLSDRKAADVAAYVRLHLHDADDPGGLSLWHLGPVPEGLVAWVVGLGAVLLMCRVLGERSGAR